LFDARQIRPYLLAPFDRRYVYYDPRVLGRARLSVMRHMLWPNLGLVFMRQSTGRGPYDHFLTVDCLVSDRVFYSRHGAPFLAPLWLWEEGASFGVQGSTGREPGTGHRGQGTGNFEPQFLDAMAASLGTPACEPLPVFHYLYAVAYSPTYRERFAEQLRQGFPRFPLPASRETYRRLSDLGGRLVALHAGPTQWDYESAGSEEVFRLGGYDVLRRWARPRTKHGLTSCDQHELERLAWIGRATTRLMREFDLQSPDHWSGC
jgi:predicted helicase